MTMLIQLSDVRVADPSKTRLQPLTTSVEAGEFVVVLGQNGAGKSTLLDVVSGLTSPTSGEVRHLQEKGFPRGVDANHGGTPALSYLFQSPEQSLFAGTILEEFALTWKMSVAKVRARSAEVNERLQSVGLSDVDLNDTPAMWSTGMQRRLAFALAMAQSPNVLLLDEPSAGLDRSSVDAIVEELRTLHGSGRTVLLATHDLDTFIPLASRVWLLDAGRMVFDGTPTTLYENPSLLLTHGLGLPASLRLQVALKAARFVDRVGISSPKELSGVIEIRSQASAPPDVSLSNPPVSGAGQGTQAGLASAVSVLDARSRWIAITCFTIAVACSHTPISRLTDVVLTFGFLGWLRAKPKRVLQWSIPWALFAVFTTVIAGTRFGWPFTLHPYSFYWGPAKAAMISVLPYWCFLQLGQLLVAQTTVLQLQGMMDWLAGKVRLPRSARKVFVLTVGMVFRFIPAIRTMYQAQLRAYRARTLTGMRRRSRPAIRVSHVIAPLLIRLIQYGEATTDALVARNLLGRSVRYQVLVDQTWTRKDWAFLVYGLCCTFAVIVASC